MFVALTGTPGTGKSAVSELLRERGYPVRTVEELARKHHTCSVDDDCLIVDVDALASKLGKEGGKGFLVGHMAHLLPNRLCIVLRAHPNLIIERLRARGYADEKVMANAEAEAIDLILIEALDCSEHVREIDCSDLTAEDVATTIEGIANGNDEGFPPGSVDWSEVVMSWY